MQCEEVRWAEVGELARRFVVDGLWFVVDNRLQFLRMLWEWHIEQHTFVHLR